MSIHERTSEPRGGELLELLRSRSPFDSLSGPLLKELVDACEVLNVPGGTRLLRAGQLPDSLYGVLNGALRLVRRNDDGVEQSIGEFYRGDMLGFIGMFLEHPVPAEIVVVRDSTLVRLARERFLALTEKEPVLMRAVLHVLSENISDLIGAMSGARKELAPRHAGNLGLITLSRDGAVRGTVEQLVRVMTLGGAAVRVTAEDVDAALGAGAAENEDSGSRVTQWLDNLESEAGAVIYESGPLQRTWATRFVRQSDRLLVVVASGDEGRIDEIATMLTRATTGGLSRQVHFLLVHPRETELPSGTRVWSRIAGVTRVHHVRSGERRDLERVARHVFGRSIGVALSGGGARGIAHLGVLAAMAEADIPIDYICGTISPVLCSWSTIEAPSGRAFVPPAPFPGSSRPCARRVAFSSMVA